MQHFRESQFTFFNQLYHTQSSERERERERETIELLTAVCTLHTPTTNYIETQRDTETHTKKHRKRRVITFSFYLWEFTCHFIIQEVQGCLRLTFCKKSVQCAEWQRERGEEEEEKSQLVDKKLAKMNIIWPRYERSDSREWRGRGREERKGAKNKPVEKEAERMTQQKRHEEEATDKKRQWSKLFTFAHTK